MTGPVTPEMLRHRLAEAAKLAKEALDLAARGSTAAAETAALFAGVWAGEGEADPGTNPFTIEHPRLQELWARGHREGREAEIPRASVARPDFRKPAWTPQPGTTFAARSAPQD